MDQYQTLLCDPTPLLSPEHKVLSPLGSASTLAAHILCATEGDLFLTPKFNCHIGDGTVYSAGIGEYGQLGLDSNTSQKDLVKIPNLRNVSRLACGGYHSLALTDAANIDIRSSQSGEELNLPPYFQPQLLESDLSVHNTTTKSDPHSRIDRESSKPKISLHTTPTKSQQDSPKSTRKRKNGSESHTNPEHGHPHDYNSGVRPLLSSHSLLHKTRPRSHTVPHEDDTIIDYKTPNSSKAHTSSLPKADSSSSLGQKPSRPTENSPMQKGKKEKGEKERKRRSEKGKCTLNNFAICTSNQSRCLFQECECRETAVGRRQRRLKEMRDFVE